MDAFNLTREAAIVTAIVARMERSEIRGWHPLQSFPDFAALHPGYGYYGYGRPAPIIARRASASPISTKAEVTSGPPTRIRVGVFILFHS